MAELQQEIQTRGNESPMAGKRELRRPSLTSSIVLPRWLVGAALLGLTLAIAWPIYGAGDSPPGIDVFGHLFKPWYMLQHFQEYGNVPDWLPHWYNGTSLTQYYPPLSYYALFGLALLTGDIFSAYSLFVTLSILASSWLTYLLARRWLDPVPSLATTLAFQAAPYTLMTIFWEGNLPRTLAMVFLPLVFLLSVRLLERDGRRDFVALAAAMAGLVLAHHMPAVAAIAGLIPFAAVYTWKQRLEVGRPIRVYLAMALGVGLSAWWLVPAVTHIDLAAVPDLSTLPERIDSYSTGLTLVDPRTRFDRNAYLGLSILLATVAALVLPGHKVVKWSCVGGAATGIFLSLGQNNPLYPYVPLLSYWFPERFLQMSALFLAISVGISVQVILREVRSPYRIAAAGLLLVLLIADLAPGLALARPTVHEQLQRVAVNRISEWLATQENDGRLLVQAAINWETAFTPFSVGKKAQNYGWAPEGTPHTATAQEVNYALSMEYYGFPLRTFSLWNTRYLVLESTNDGQMELANRMLQQGWKKASLRVPWTVLYSDQPPSLLMKQDRDVIAVGRGAMTAASLFPWVARGVSRYVDDYDYPFLSQFKGIWLYDYRYRDREKAEQLLYQLAAEGRTVWVDLSFREAETLFEAFPSMIDFTGALILEQVGEGPRLVDGSGKVGSFHFKNQHWRTFVPPAQSGFVPVVQAEIDGYAQPIISKRTVGSGSIYLVGLGLASQAFLNHDVDAAHVMQALLAEVDPNTRIAPDPFPTLREWWQDEAFGFEAEVERPTHVIISATYTPRWRAYVDGSPVRIYNHENLMLIRLPAGRHEVRFEYSWSPGQVVGLATSAVSILALAAGLLLPSRRLTPAVTHLWKQILAAIGWERPAV